MVREEDDEKMMVGAFEGIPCSDAQVNDEKLCTSELSFFLRGNTALTRSTRGNPFLWLSTQVRGLVKNLVLVSIQHVKVVLESRASLRFEKRIAH